MSPENIELEEQRAEPDGIYMPEESNGFLRYEQPPNPEVPDSEPKRYTDPRLVAAIILGLVAVAASVTQLVILWIG